MQPASRCPGFCAAPAHCSLGCTMLHCKTRKRARAWQPLQPPPTRAPPLWFTVPLLLPCRKLLVVGLLVATSQQSLTVQVGWWSCHQ